MKQGPRLIFWELTKQCNLRCVHCRAEARLEESANNLQLQQIQQVIDTIASKYKPILVLTGGEPLFRTDIFEIASYAKQHELKVALATNGTLISNEIAATIKDSGIERVSISIDGASAGTHDKFRGIDGVFAQAMEGINHLKHHGVPFQINTTVTKRNVDELDKIVHFALNCGAKALHIFMLVPVGCGIAIADSDMISKERYEEVLHWFYMTSKKVAIELKATCAPHYYRIIRQKAKKEGRELSFETDGLNAVTRGCLAGTGVCFISHTGEVQPCGYLPLSVGNVIAQPFPDIWENAALFRNLRDLSNLLGKCGCCEYKMFCAGCRARAFYETGDPFSEEPYCVHMPKKAGGL